MTTANVVMAEGLREILLRWVDLANSFESSMVIHCFQKLLKLIFLALQSRYRLSLYRRQPSFEPRFRQSGLFPAQSIVDAVQMCLYSVRQIQLVCWYFRSRIASSCFGQGLEVRAVGWGKHGGHGDEFVEGELFAGWSEEGHRDLIRLVKLDPRKICPRPV